MKNTENFELNLFEDTDKFDVAELNKNMEIIDENLVKGGTSAPETTTIYTEKPTAESYVTTVTKEDL